MKSKDKVKRHMKLTLKNIIIILALILIILYLLIFYNHYLGENEVYAKEQSKQINNQENIKISKAEQINLDEIIEKNANTNQKEEYIVEEVDLEYITKYQNNNNLPKETIQVLQEGREGKQQITKKRTYENGEIVSEEQVNSKVIKASVSKIVEVGTGNFKNNYKVKTGDIVYVTSDRVGIMVEPSETSQKIATLTRGTELKVLSVHNDWYRISGQGTSGYIKIENTTYQNQNSKTELQGKSNTGSNTIAKLSFDINLNKPSRTFFRTI